MFFWKSLQLGDVVEIVAPAFRSTQRELQKSIDFVRRLGLKPRVPKDIFGRDWFCAHSDSERFRHLRRAIQATDSKAIWSLRGGWGSARILPLLSRLKAPRGSKVFIGYSDMTTLHLFFNSRWNWPTLHSPMLSEWGQNLVGKGELSSFRRVLFGEREFLEYGSLEPLNEKAQKKRILKGCVMGGNLTLLQASLGTPWQVSAKGKILVLEEVGERGYRVDRMLVHLQQAGLFQGALALVFGHLLGKDSRYLWKYIRKDFAKRLVIPVLKGLPLGHGRRQKTVPLGTFAELQLGEKKGNLRIHSGFSTN